MLQVVLYVLACLFVAVFAAYTRSFQGATIFWGKALAPDNELLPRGMQDAITPPAQANRLIVSWLSYLAVIVLGVVFFRWYVGFGAFFLTVLGSWVVGIFLPKPDSRFYFFQIMKSLVDRRAKFLSASDELRVEVADVLIEKLKSHLPTVLGLESVRTDPGRRPEVPQEATMSVEAAQELVHKVAALLEQRRGCFLDSRFLPRPRAEVELAFAKLLESYEQIRAMSPEGYAKRGYEDTVRQIKTLRAFLDSFKDIDESDRAQVQKANAVWAEKGSTDVGFAEFLDEFKELVAKYGLG